MIHVPRHALALARFGIPALRSAGGLARSSFSGEAARALFTGLAAQRNGCGAGPPTRVRLDGAEDIHAAGCPSAPTLVAIDDAGHTWPGGPVGTGSQPPGRFDATAFLWGRFVAAVTG